MPQYSDSSIRIGFDEEVKLGATIKIVGVGGGGNNAINRMVDAGVQGVEFIAMNTDLQPLQESKAHTRLQLGTQLTRGRGTGSDPEVGRRAALDDSEKILEALQGADMVFVTAGLGGGTGTGAAPVIASLASQMGALTVAIVTRPFGFEGKRRMNQAEQGLQELLDNSDTLIVIPNEKLLAVAKDAGFFESFQIADDVLRQAVQGISDIVTVRGVINRDFADVRTTMAGMGHAVMGTATRSGPNRAAEAAQAAMTSPLLEAGAIDGARGILINITGSSSLKLAEVSEASTIIQNAAHEDANIIFGAVLDERLGDQIMVTLIATGFREDSCDRAEHRLHLLNRVGQEQAVTNEEQPQAMPEASAEPDVIAADLFQAVENAQEEIEPVEPIEPLEPPAESPENLFTDHESFEQEQALAEHTEAAEVSLEAVALFEASEDSESLEEPASTPDLYITNEWFDYDLHADVHETTLEPEETEVNSKFEPEATPPAAPEIVRLRKTALAAYAATATSTPEKKKKEEPVPEPASFAEILANRAKLLKTAFSDRKQETIH